MSNAVWPASLPEYVQVAGYGEVFAKNSIATPNDMGPPDVRPRGTAALEQIQFGAAMSGAQVSTLKTFYDTTLSYGTKPFDWVHPRTRADRTFSFLGTPPTVSAVGPDEFQVSFTLHMKP